LNAHTIGKLMMTLALAIFTFIPPIADLATDTHVFHPDWSPHSRLHTVWLLGVTSSMGLLALSLLWASKAESRFNENLAGAIGACVYGSFFLSVITAALYGGSVTDHTGGITQNIMGFNLNVFTFSVAFATLLLGWGICAKLREDQC
jgi:hypothetical protein